MTEVKSLTNLQLELIKLFQYELPEEQLLDIKRLLARYFAQKITNDLDILWQEKNWTNETIEQWKHEKLRVKRSEK
jgi:hypothetical protein